MRKTGTVILAWPVAAGQGIMVSNEKRADLGWKQEDIFFK